MRFVRLSSSTFRRLQERNDSGRRTRGALEGKVTFDGGSIDGFVRGEEADMILRPGPRDVRASTRGGRAPAVEARLICDIAMPDGEPFEGCPRTTLRRAIDDSSDVLAGCAPALEVEFYLFELDAEGVPTTDDRRRIVLRHQRIRSRRRGADRDRRRAAKRWASRVASAHHEHGAGQHEIDLNDAGVLATADA